MVKVKVLGVELEADLLNADIHQLYEENIKMVVDLSEKSLSCDKVSEAIRMQCNAVINCLDQVFSVGSAKKVFGEKTNLLDCLEAFADICDVDIYVKKIIDEKSFEMKARAEVKENNV